MSKDCVRLGRWEDVLQDVEPDLLLVDAPYSSRTHDAHVHSGRASRNMPDPGKSPTPINYACWSPEDVHAFVGSWAPRTRGWFVSITDHNLGPHWADALESSGRYVFSPLAFVANGSRIRLAGDGPSQWTCWIVVARPKTASFQRWGTLPGAYVLPLAQGLDSANAVIGGKPLWLGRSLVRDYSRPGDLVVDPCCGGGTFPLAALIEGRRALAAECMPEHHAIAQKRIAKGYTTSLFTESASQPEQLKLGEP